jgi:glutathione S-transferase
MMTMQLHVFPPSPRAFKVLAVANYLELPYQITLADLRKGEQRTPEYACMNPNMRMMPTMKDGDYVLWESNAIQQYLALRRPEAGLLPSDERGRLDVTRWQFWDLAHWDSACAVFVFERVVKAAFLGIDQPDPAALARGEELFHRAARVLDDQLASRAFVTGPKLTLADFSLGAALSLAPAAKYPLQPYQQINRWYGTLSSLPAWKKSLEQSTLPALS